jgi:2-haloacid dehalogenase
MSERSIAVFDLGGVLIDWNPRYLYRQLFEGDEAGMEHFLATVCTSHWNLQQDAGRSLAEGCGLLRSQYPDYSIYIDAWEKRYEEMLRGPIQGTVDVLAELRTRGVPVYALSNWSAETFPSALRRFEFLQWFDGTLISGHVRLIKPDPRIFQLFLKTHGVDPSEAVYIDDLQHNVDAAAAMGMHGIRFTDPQDLRKELIEVGVLREVD